MKFRYARHTKDLAEIQNFYTKILGFEILGKFENHDNYNGIFLGKKDRNWHLEFTVSDEIPDREFDEDDLLVFYPETIIEYENILRNIDKNSIKILKPKNPYWIENGIFIKDTDGFGIIISKQFAK